MIMITLANDVMVWVWCVRLRCVVAQHSIGILLIQANLNFILAFISLWGTCLALGLSQRPLLFFSVE